jgi:hypothetical protein
VAADERNLLPLPAANFQAAAEQPSDGIAAAGVEPAPEFAEKLTAGVLNAGNGTPQLDRGGSGGGEEQWSNPAGLKGDGEGRAMEGTGPPKPKIKIKFSGMS